MAEAQLKHLFIITTHLLSLLSPSISPLPLILCRVNRRQVWPRSIDLKEGRERKRNKAKKKGGLNVVCETISEGDEWRPRNLLEIFSRITKGEMSQKQI